MAAYLSAAALSAAALSAAALAAAALAAAALTALARASLCWRSIRSFMSASSFVSSAFSATSAVGFLFSTGTFATCGAGPLPDGAEASAALGAASTMLPGSPELGADAVFAAGAGWAGAVWNCCKCDAGAASAASSSCFCWTPGAAAIAAGAVDFAAGAAIDGAVVAAGTGVRPTRPRRRPPARRLPRGPRSAPY